MSADLIPKGGAIMGEQEEEEEEKTTVVECLCLTDTELEEQFMHCNSCRKQTVMHAPILKRCSFKKRSIGKRIQRWILQGFCSECKKRSSRFASSVLIHDVTKLVAEALAATEEAASECDSLC